MFFTLNRSFYTRRHPAQTPVYVPILQSSLYNRYKFCGHKSYATEILRCHVPIGSKHSSEWAMQCHVIIQDTIGTTYAFYEIEKRKKTKKTHKQREIEREKEEKGRRKKREETNCRAPPPRRCGKHLKRTSWEK